MKIVKIIFYCLTLICFGFWVTSFYSEWYGLGHYIVSNIFDKEIIFYLCLHIIRSLAVIAFLTLVITGLIIKSNKLQIVAVILFLITYLSLIFTLSLGYQHYKWIAFLLLLLYSLPGHILLILLIIDSKNKSNVIEDDDVEQMPVSIEKTAPTPCMLKEKEIDNLEKRIFKNVLFSLAYIEPSIHESYNGRIYRDLKERHPSLLSLADIEFMKKFEAWVEQYNSLVNKYSYKGKTIVDTVLPFDKEKAFIYVDFMSILNGSGYFNEYSPALFQEQLYNVSKAFVKRTPIVVFSKGSLLIEIEKRFAEMIKNVCRGELVSTKIGFSTPISIMGRSNKLYASQCFSNYHLGNDRVFSFDTKVVDKENKKKYIRSYADDILLHDGGSKADERTSVIIVFEVNYSESGEPSKRGDDQFEHPKFRRAAEKVLKTL